MDTWKENVRIMDETVKLKMGVPRILTLGQSNILNVSLTFVLSEGEEALLEKGLFFIPTPWAVDRDELQRDLHRYHRRLKLLDHFEYNTDRTREPFIDPSVWEPDWESVSDPIKKLIRRDVRSFERVQYKSEKEQNLSEGERKALTQLKCNQDIVIKPAD